MLQMTAPTTETYQSEFSFAQAATGQNLIPDTWLLLDSQSTVSVFKNRALLSNIRRSPRTLRVHTNGGTQISTEIGTVKNFGDVWFNTNSLANILSMADVRKICRITMDTSIEPALIVHCQNGTLMKFKEYKSGLYYLDTAASQTQSNLTRTGQDYLFLNTVAANKGTYTRREIEGADKARELYAKLGRPSQQHFEYILANNLINNCPVTADDAKRAITIYGPDTATLKGKMTKHNGQHVPTFTPIQVPQFLLAHHKNITICENLFLSKASHSCIQSSENYNFAP